MRIKKHEESHIVELEDDSTWRVWPGDIAASLYWMPTTDFEVREINDECWTHILIDNVHGACVRVIEANETWAPEEIEASLVS